ncbi:MAG: putative nucleoside-diphosphate sugar epimerase [Planctomycetota bacterium]|nr:putative nucleoside-diphosphate sugar epimerase [Planctomycetota bacterium]
MTTTTAFPPPSPTRATHLSPHVPVPAAGRPVEASESVEGDGRRANVLVEIYRSRIAEIHSCGRVSVLVILHGLAFAAIYLLAHVVRFDGAVPPALWEAAMASLPLIVGLKVAAFLARGCERGWWRSASFADLTSLGEAVTLGSLAVVLAGALAGGNWLAPRSILFIDWAGTLLALCGARGAARLLRDYFRPLFAAQRLRRVLVVGTGEAVEAVVRQVGVRPELGLKVVGLLDPDRATHGRTLAGVRVLGAPGDLARIAALRGVEAVLIPTPAVPAREVRALLLACDAAGLKAKIVPGFDAILSGALVAQPRDVDIQDLLCRAPVQLDGEAIGSYLEGLVVLVTGASGSIGSEICRQVLAFRPARLILLDHSENGLFYLERDLRPLAAEATEIVPRTASITDVARIRSLFSRYRPDVVFHAAAHKHVPMMESNPGEAVKNNVFGTRTVVDEAIRAGVEAFVMISTDKAVNPTSVMGACKRLAEIYVQSLADRSSTRLVTVRFGNVLGSAGSVVPIFREQIRKGGPLTVTHPDMTRFFMTIPEAAQLVLQAGALGKGGEIFVLDMGEPVRVLDLARDMIRLSGQDEGRDVEIVFTGMRPGEKLYEELYDDGEELLATAHPKIRVAQHRPCSPKWLLAGFERLAAAVEEPCDRVVAILRDLVPGYRPGKAGCAWTEVPMPAGDGCRISAHTPRPSLHLGDPNDRMPLAVEIFA